MIRPSVMTGIAITAVLAPDAIESHSINVVTAISVVATISCGVWWLSNRFTRIEDRLAKLEENIKGLPCPKLCAVVEKVEPIVDVLHKAVKEKT